MRRIRWLPLLSIVAVVAGVVTGVILSPGTVGIVLAIAGLTLAVLTDKEGYHRPPATHQDVRSPLPDLWNRPPGPPSVRRDLPDLPGPTR